jgi:hypothetical protein
MDFIIFFKYSCVDNFLFIFELCKSLILLLNLGMKGRKKESEREKKREEKKKKEMKEKE